MAQNTDIIRPPVVYTRTDYTALRAYCQRVELDRIATLYYSEDSPQVQQGLERFLIGMRDFMIECAGQNNPLLVESLTHARATGHVPASVMSILVEAANRPTALPSPADPISRWFRPRTTRALKSESIETLADLVALINRRGGSWWRSVPRIGAKRAAVALAWLERHEDQLGPLSRAPSPPPSTSAIALLDPASRFQLLPLNSYYLPEALAGLTGLNRSPLFCFISARDDLAAVNCYLEKFAGQAHTLRAYRKELERFVLWSVLVARKPMSSLLVNECEAYKRFLASPAPEFCGPAALRTSGRWRPFGERKMDPASQAYAIKVLRAAFDWLVKVRYLAGNPWAAVTDPVVVQEVNAIQVDRALPLETWSTVVQTLQRRGLEPENVQDRVALVALLLMGDSGLRRFELAGAMRAAARPSRHAKGIYMLTVLGKRNKKRQVPVSPRTIAALRAHWSDRGEDFDNPEGDRPLLVPLALPATAAARNRHSDTVAQRQGYTPNAIYALVETALHRVMLALDVTELVPGMRKLTGEEIEHLCRTSPHAFRHTFGSAAAEKEMPLHALQEILGHSDSATTAIYTKAREKRIAEAAAQFYEMDGETGGH